jgi:hypothetical protein
VLPSVERCTFRFGDHRTERFALAAFDRLTGSG